MPKLDELDRALDVGEPPLSKCITCALVDKHEELSSDGKPRTVPEAIAIWYSRREAGTTQLSLAGLHRLLVRQVGYLPKLRALQGHISNHLPGGDK